MKKKAGLLVETKAGNKGVIYHEDDSIVVNGKVKRKVHLSNGSKILVEDDNIKLIGFID